jgi:hypothetical protein
MNGTNGVSALDRMAHEFLRNDVLVTLSHRAEVLGPYKRHSPAGFTAYAIKP